MFGQRPSRQLLALFACGLLLAASFSCRSDPGPAPGPIVVVEEAPVQAVFDPMSISEAVLESALFDIRGFIDDLNGIVQARDYEAWNQYLTEAYRAHYSSPEVLAELSENFIIRRQGIVLQSLRDYFIYVVYPSRQNDKVDEIEFIDQDLVRAYTYDTRGNRLVLYTLQNVDSTWKITRL